MSESLSTSEQHQQVTDAVMEDIQGGETRAVIVDSPPGAGKSTFVARAAACLLYTSDAADE